MKKTKIAAVFITALLAITSIVPISQTYAKAKFWDKIDQSAMDSAEEISFRKTYKGDFKTAPNEIVYYKFTLQNDGYFTISGLAKFRSRDSFDYWDNMSVYDKKGLRLDGDTLHFSSPRYDDELGEDPPEKFLFGWDGDYQNGKWFSAGTYYLRMGGETVPYEKAKSPFGDFSFRVDCKFSDHKFKSLIKKERNRDVKLSTSRIDSIEWLISKEITQLDCTSKPHYEFGTFYGDRYSCNYNPGNPVNRGAMAEFMWKLKNKQATDKAVPKISDISKLVDSRKNAIKWLASEKITVLDKSKYNPKNPVNRGAMAEFMWKLAGKPTLGNLNAQAKTLAKDKNLNKLKESKPDRYNSILWLTKMNITVPDKGKYNPQNVVNRGAMAQFLHKLYYVIETGNAVPKNGTVPEI